MQHDCDTEQVRYLYLNLPAPTYAEIGQIVGLSRAMVEAIVTDDARFLTTVQNRREVETESSRLIRSEAEEKLRLRRGIK